jgi:hypothetical protein
MAFRTVAAKTYRLRDGDLGTEYQYVLERIKILQRELQETEDQIELLRLRLNLADGHP